MRGIKYKLYKVFNVLFYVLGVVKKKNGLLVLMFVTVCRFCSVFYFCWIIDRKKNEAITKNSMAPTGKTQTTRINVCVCLGCGL